MANTSKSVMDELLAVADKRAAEYEAARETMLSLRQATRDAANMATDLSTVLSLPAPEFSEAVTKVLAKRQSRSATVADEDDE